MTLLEMSIAGAVLIIAILLIRAVTINRLPKQTFLILWGLALLRLLVPFTIPSAFSVYSLINRNIPEEIRADLPAGILLGRASAEDSPAAAISTPDSPATDVLTTQHSAPDILAPDSTAANVSAPQHSASDILAPDSTAANASASQHSASAALTPAPSKSSDNDPEQSPIKAESPDQPDSILPKEAAASQRIAAVLFILWCTGAASCAVFFILSYLRCRLEFSTSLPVRDLYVLQWLAEHPARRHITVRQLDRINTPLTYGILHPIILLPRQTDFHNTAWLQYVLAHEYVHIRRLDAVTKLLMALALCLHWFNPLVWVMYLLYNRDLELACDEKVIRQYGETSKTAYARMLIDMEVKKSGLMPLCNHFSKNAIEERITAIMKIKKISRSAILFAAGLIIGVTAAFATSAPYSSAVDHTAVPAARNVKAGMSQADASDIEDSAEYEAAMNLLTETQQQITETERQIAALQIQEEEMHAKIIDAIYQLEAQIVLQKQLAEQLSPYFPLGLTYRYDAARARFKMYFQGREVRGIYDEENGVYISEHAGIGESIYDEEPIELYTVYENGKLTALREATAQEMAAFTKQRQLISN